MLTESIIVALITGIFSTIGAFISVFVIIKKKSRETEIKEVERETRQSMRLDSIEKKLDEHNHYAQKFGEIEKSIVRIDTILSSIKKERS